MLAVPRWYMTEISTENSHLWQKGVWMTSCAFSWFLGCFEALPRMRPLVNLELK